MRTAALSTRRPKIKDLREIADGQFRFAISEVLAARAFGGHEPNARNAAPCTDVSSVLEDNAACHVGGPVDMAAFARVIDINLMGTVSVMTKCAARMMALEKLNDDGERGIPKPARGHSQECDGMDTAFRRRSRWFRPDTA